MTVASVAMDPGCQTNRVCGTAWHAQLVISLLTAFSVDDCSDILVICSSTCAWLEVTRCSYETWPAGSLMYCV
jgi:hypothetical protein